VNAEEEKIESEVCVAQRKLRIARWALEAKLKNLKADARALKVAEILIRQKV